MTQKQRMEQGLIYDPMVDEIMNEQSGVSQYMKEYNTLGLGDEKRIEELLPLMLAECGENCYLQPPFYANWGGAGHSRRLDNEKNLQGVFDCAYNVVKHCNCGGSTGDTSCYSCLRNYKNQKYHDMLRRDYAIDFFESLM